ncbi:hypothetical protein EUX98_g8614 [Antrodiella citrinella]|uniref:Uncharacterized protein n=1 Tax=Antrodiella citrinella TaxID=2447956 RepID=A0A4S4M5H5_9APHY|nr:hypothetical protein EUX98_g8614 [Antrodiella citrinella]
MSFTTPSPSPPLPIEIWERIIDFVAGGDDDSQHSLLHCFLVCRACVPRCRFRLGPRSVSLRSRDDFMHFSALLAVYPHSASKLHKLYIHGPKLLTILDVNLTQQHPDLIKLYSKFKLEPEELDEEAGFHGWVPDEGIKLIRVSFLHLAQVSRLAYATRARKVWLDGCPLWMPISNSTFNRPPPRNTLLTVTQMELTFKSWSELLAMPTGWFSAYSNLYELEIVIDKLDSFPQGWSHLCALFQRCVKFELESQLSTYSHCLMYT